jgi:hypothetical protein
MLAAVKLYELGVCRPGGRPDSWHAAWVLLALQRYKVFLGRRADDLERGHA